MKTKWIRNEIGMYGYATTKLLKVLNDFARSDLELAKIIYEPRDYSSVASARGSISAAIKRFGYCFRVRSIKGELYLDRRI